VSGEAALSRTVCVRLRELGFDVQRHEDALSAGIPDISYGWRNADGWLELKSLGEWPKRAETPVNLGIRPEQVNWLMRRGRAGSGRAWLLARVGADQTHLLLGYWNIRAAASGLTREQLLAACEETWRPRIDWPELGRILVTPVREV
jgi:hypothetical protein